MTCIEAIIVNYNYYNYYFFNNNCFRNRVFIASNIPISFGNYHMLVAVIDIIIVNTIIVVTVIIGFKIIKIILAIVIVLCNTFLNNNYLFSFITNFELIINILTNFIFQNL
jgi:glucan phosphoethanolaminetransferase (alkaline phosphatase superfamily)